MDCGQWKQLNSLERSLNSVVILGFVCFGDWKIHDHYPLRFFSYSITELWFRVSLKNSTSSTYSRAVRI